MLDFLKKKFSELKDSQNTKDITKLIKLLAPLTDTIPILVIIKQLSENQKFLIRDSAFIWGYLNTLTKFNAKKLSISEANQAVLLTASLELYASMFLIDVEIAKKEYKKMYDTIKKNKSAKDLFANGAMGCAEDMKQIHIEVPNRMHPLKNLHVFLNVKMHEVRNNEK